MTFLLFLALYAVFFLAVGWITSLEKKKRASGSFIFGEIKILLSSTIFFVSLYLLSGYFDWTMTLAFIGIQQLTAIAIRLLFPFLNSVPHQIRVARAKLLYFELGLKNPNKMILIFLIGAIVILIVVPTLAGINYFRSSPTELTPRIFQSLLLLVFAGVATSWIFGCYYLLSESPNQNERTLLVVNQLATLLPMSLYLSTFFWSLGMQGHGIEFTAGSVSLAISPILLSLLVAQFLFMALIPYLTGNQRGRRLRSDLLENRLAWLQKFQDVLDQPTKGGYWRKLDALRQSLVAETDQFVNNDPLIKTGDDIDGGRIPRSADAILDDFQLTRNMDPRFTQLDALRRIADLITELQTQLLTLATDAERQRVIKDWLVYLRGLKRSVGTELAAVQQADVGAILRFSGITAVGSTIVLAVLSEVAKGLWRNYSGFGH
jgi:hypothetical protein